MYVDKYMNVFFMQKQNTRGFIALMSSVIISTVLLGLALTAGASGAFSRFDALNAEYKRVSLALAESCANSALLKIAQNYNYAPAGEVVTIGVDGQGRTETCTIKSVSFPNGKGSVQNTAVITTQAQYPATNGAFTTITISSTVQNPAFAVPARASVVVQTHVVNNDGGTKQAGDFQITMTAGNPSPSTFAGTETGQIVYVDPGVVFNVGSTNDASYSKTPSGDCSDTLTAGQVVNCTITYDDIPTVAMLTATVTVKNDNGGTKLPSDFPVFIDGASVISGVPASGLVPGSHTASAAATPAGYSASVWGTDCTVPGTGVINLLAGQKKTCTIVYDDNPPPAPICVDTVLMLDRTGSMGGQDLTDEKNAANNLLGLYAALTPLPKSSVGVFGAVGSGEPYNANIRQALTTVYSSLTSAVNTGLSSSDGYTNLASAINVSQGEFTANGTPGKGHILILLSDGGANRPNGSTPADTGWKFPTANAQNGAGDAWTTPAGAYGASYAADAGAHRHRYSNFGLSVPGTATVSNVEIKTDAWSTLFLSAGTLFTDGFGTGNTDSTFDESPSWTEGGSGAEKRTSGSGNDTPSADGGRFAVVFDNGWICEQVNAAGFSSLNLSYYWRGDADANSSSDQGIVEYRTSGNCSSGSGWQTIQTHDLRNDTSWSTQPAFGLPGSSSNATFYLRFRAQSNANEYFRVDGVKITGTTNTACTLGVDLSWNGGTNWTSEDTQLLTNASAPYTFSGAWGGHTWVPADFSDANFRARIHETNAGPTCIVDNLQARISYTTAVDPYEAALAAADAAKLAGTQIFTIHFGDPGNANRDINFLANVANGTTAVSGHQNGSANDLSDVPANGTVGFLSPASLASPSQFTNPTRAYASDNSYATDATNGHQQGYGTFGLVVPAGSYPAGVEVNVEAKSSDNNGCQVGVELSSNGGTSFTNTGTLASLSNSDNTYTLGGTANLWGRTWVPSDFADGKFVVRLQNIDPGNNCSNGSTLSVDRVQVRVSYNGAVPENTDGDNFYVSPTSADMPGIFQAIGEKVCPALTAPPPAPPPTHGTLLLITHVINDNGGTNQSSDFPITVTGLNPSPSVYPIPGEDAPGTPITLDPGLFSVTEDLSGLLYGSTLTGCSGTIQAGDVLTCSIVNDDLPPPTGSTGTPVPPSNINIGSWSESP